MGLPEGGWDSYCFHGGLDTNLGAITQDQSDYERALEGTLREFIQEADRKIQRGIRVRFVLFWWGGLLSVGMYIYVCVYICVRTDYLTASSSPHHQTYNTHRKTKYTTHPTTARGRGGGVGKPRRADQRAGGHRGPP